MPKYKVAYGVYTKADTSLGIASLIFELFGTCFCAIAICAVL